MSVLDGGIDLHRHGFPEIADQVHPPLSDVDDLERCRAAGMRGVVLKSHVWPTIGRAYHLRRRVEGLEVFSSITLNPTAGGLDPRAVELAARQGAKVVYLPTWGARNDIERGGFSKLLTGWLGWPDLSPEAGLSLLDASGELTATVRDILEVAGEHRLVVITGHISTQESLAIARSGLADGRLVFAHPDSHSIGATTADIEAMAAAGAYIELCALGLHPRIARITPAEMADIVRRVGADRCVMTSDYFFEWAPPSTESLTMLWDALAGEGIAEADLRTMAVKGPARLLGLDEDPAT